MSTTLGLYGGPVSAYTSALTAISTSFVVNVEVHNGTALSDTTASINIEVRPSVVFSGSSGVINLEVSDPFNTAGTPDAILNLPTYTISPRIRADFYEWTVSFVTQRLAREDIGAKVGTAPLVSGHNFQYSSKLSAAGEWSITVALPDTHASVIFDGTAKIIKVYMENVGQIFTGWITGYEVNEEGTVTLHGYDLGYELMTVSPLWRKTLTQPNTSYNLQIVRDTSRGFWWIIYAHVFSGPQLIDNGYYWRRHWESGVMPPSPPAREFSVAKNNFKVDMLIGTESESWLEVLRNLEEVTGCPFRFHPVTGTPTVGLLGEETDFVLAPVQEDDPFAREDGALILKSISYSVDRENICNMIVPQGSNDSFGIAVELRHADADHYRRQNIGWNMREVNDDIVNANGYIIINNGNFLTATLQSTGDAEADAESDGLISTVQAAGPVAMVGAVAWKIRFNEDRYFTFAAIRNWGGAGTLGCALVESPNPPTTESQVYIDSVMSSGLAPYISSSEGELIHFPGDVVATYPDEAATTGNQRKDQTSGLLRDEITGSFTEVLIFPKVNTAYGTLEDGIPMRKIKANTNYWLVFYDHNTFRHFANYSLQVSPRLGALRGSNPGSSTWVRKNGIWSAPSNYGLFAEISLWDPNNGRWSYAIEGSPAKHINDNGSGSRIFFMRNLESIAEWGHREKVVSFPQASDAEVGEVSIVPMSNMLHQQASVYLDRHSEPQETISVTITGSFRLPWVGNKIRLVYRGLVQTENGKYIWKDFNDLYYVTEITWNISESGIEHTFQLSNFPVNGDAGMAAQADLFRYANRTKNHLGELKTGSNRLGRFASTSNNTSNTSGSLIHISP